MAIKKYSSGGWQPTTYRRYGTETDTITSLPAQIIGDGQVITSCQISGNTIQDGTPAPEAPVEVKGVGVKTSNLVDWDSFINSIDSIYGEGTYTATSTSISITSGTSTDAYTFPYNASDTATYRLKVKPNTTYSIRITGSGNYQLILWKNGLGAAGYGYYFNLAKKFATITTDSATTFFTLRAANTGSLGSTATLSNVMIIEGEYTEQTMPAYEPYGYKLDISSGGRNLCDSIPYKINHYIDANGVETPIADFDIYSVSASPNTTYTLSLDTSLQGTRVRIHSYSNGSWSEQIATQMIDLLPMTFTTPQDCDEIRFSINQKALNHIMLNLGSTALPYEPYNRITTPIYLGQAPTTRRIKKLVLTGNEAWNENAAGTDNCFFNIVISDSISGGVAGSILCTHFVETEIFSVTSSVGIWLTGARNLRLRPDNVATLSLTDFKSYLAAQYAAGTPVTVWYILATPKTGIVNEPLMKIGDYADTVSATNIPTTGTPENFDVGTSLKPSEVQLTYHGWHEHTDTKYTQGGR